MGEKVCIKQKYLNVIFWSTHQDSFLKCHFLIMPTLTIIYVATHQRTGQQDLAFPRPGPVLLDLSHTTVCLRHSGSVHVQLSCRQPQRSHPLQSYQSNIFSRLPADHHPWQAAWCQQPCICWHLSYLKMNFPKPISHLFKPELKSVAGFLACPVYPGLCCGPY